MLYRLFILCCIIVCIILFIILIKSHDTFTVYNGFKYSDKLSLEDIKDLKKGQKIMTDMLKTFNIICRKYNLKYP